MSSPRWDFSFSMLTTFSVTNNKIYSIAAAHRNPNNKNGTIRPFVQRNPSNVPFCCWQIPHNVPLTCIGSITRVNWFAMQQSNQMAVSHWTRTALIRGYFATNAPDSKCMWIIRKCFGRNHAIRPNRSESWSLFIFQYKNWRQLLRGKSWCASRPTNNWISWKFPEYFCWIWKGFVKII